MKMPSSKNGEKAKLEKIMNKGIKQRTALSYAGMKNTKVKAMGK